MEFIKKYDLTKYGISNTSIGVYNNKTLYYNFKKHELFDIASMTKLFTLALVYTLSKKGLFDLNDKYNKHIDCDIDITIKDMLKMKHYIEIEKNLRLTNSYEEFKSVLLKGKVLEERPHYNDIGFCLLGVLVEYLTNKSLQENFEDLFLRLGLNNTKINPKGYVLYGNANLNRLPHDFKTRIAAGITGAAGIFSNVEDLIKFGKLIVDYKVFDESFIDGIFEYNFKDVNNRNMTFSGLHKYTDIDISYVKRNRKALSHQGFTGVWMSFDFDSKSVSVLLNESIRLDNFKKQDNFFSVFHEMIEDITKIMYEEHTLIEK